MSKLFEGLLIGAGAGIVSSIILGGFHWVRRWILRHDQKTYLRTCVTDCFNRIRAPNDITHPGEGALPISGEQLRQAYFEEFMQSMALAVDHRTSDLSNSQMFELRHAMMQSKKHEEFVRWAVGDAARRSGQEPPTAPGVGLPVDIRFYQTIYGYFAEIRWFYLPEDMSDIES